MLLSEDCTFSTINERLTNEKCRLMIKTMLCVEASSEKVQKKIIIKVRF